MQGRVINFGLVGAGTIGRVHAGCIARSDFARLRLVHDADPAASASLGAVHGATAAGLDELLADPEIDAVIIAAPTVAHSHIARSCADAGKAFLCEGAYILNYAHQFCTKPHPQLAIQKLVNNKA